MARFEDYLIRNDRDEARFRNNYAERIGMYIDNYEAWYNRVFPPYEWRKMRVHQGSEEFAIGLLCLLMRKGRIQFSIRFPADGSIEIQREEVAPHEA